MQKAGFGVFLWLLTENNDNTKYWPILFIVRTLEGYCLKQFITEYSSSLSISSCDLDIVKGTWLQFGFSFLFLFFYFNYLQCLTNSFLLISQNLSVSHRNVCRLRALFLSTLIQYICNIYLLSWCFPSTTISIHFKSKPLISFQHWNCKQKPDLSFVHTIKNCELSLITWWLT